MKSEQHRMKGMNKPGKGLEGTGSLWKTKIVKIIVLAMIKFDKKSVT